MRDSRPVYADHDTRVAIPNQPFVYVGRTGERPRTFLQSRTQRGTSDHRPPSPPRDTFFLSVLRIAKLSHVSHVYPSRTLFFIQYLGQGGAVAGHWSLPSVGLVLELPKVDPVVDITRLSESRAY